MTFSLKKLTLGKITIDNSVKNVRKSVKSRDRDSKPKTIKNNSISRKQDKTLPQNCEKMFENVAEGRLAFNK